MTLQELEAEHNRLRAIYLAERIGVANAAAFVGLQWRGRPTPDRVREVNKAMSDVGYQIAILKLEAMRNG